MKAAENRAKKEAERVKVRMRCVVCRNVEDVGANAVPHGDHPMCMKCGGVLATIGVVRA